MSDDPFNKLPTDPEWVKRTDAITGAAATDLGCMVVLIAIQEGGKLGICVDGVPDTGILAEAAKDLPSLLGQLALICAHQEAHGMAGPKQ